MPKSESCSSDFRVRPLLILVAVPVPGLDLLTYRVPDRRADAGRRRARRRAARLARRDRHRRRRRRVGGGRRRIGNQADPAAARRRAVRAARRRRAGALDRRVLRRRRRRDAHRGAAAEDARRAGGRAQDQCGSRRSPPPGSSCAGQPAGRRRRARCAISVDCTRSSARRSSCWPASPTGSPTAAAGRRAASAPDVIARLDGARPRQRPPRAGRSRSVRGAASFDAPTRRTPAAA